MELQGSTDGMVGPGGPSITLDGGTFLIDYHYYDAWAAGQPWLQVRPLYWSADGWPITGAAMVPVPGAPPGHLMPVPGRHRHLTNMYRAPGRFGQISRKP